jgi:hypothetical protein
MKPINILIVETRKSQVGTWMPAHEFPALLPAGNIAEIGGLVNSGR